MIDKRRVKTYCNGDISLIENYDLAVNDKTQTWACHHRNEIMDDGTLHSVKWLKDNDLYFHRPASELIFMTPSEHSILHATGENHPMYGKHHSDETKIKMSFANKGKKGTFCGKHHSDESKRKMSEANKGENAPWYGKHFSDEHKHKISEQSKSRKWMNNGSVVVFVKQSDISYYQSIGYDFGRLKLKHKYI